MSDLPEGYYQCVQNLAEIALQLWIVSGEPVDDLPEVWERWVLFCHLAGVDPDDFRSAVELRLASGQTARVPLICGHRDDADNIYYPRQSLGGTTPACRECSREAQNSRWEKQRGST